MNHRLFEIDDVAFTASLEATCELRYFPAERDFIPAPDRHSAPQATAVLSGNGIRWTGAQLAGLESTDREGGAAYPSRLSTSFVSTTPYSSFNF